MGHPPMDAGGGCLPRGRPWDVSLDQEGACVGVVRHIRRLPRSAPATEDLTPPVTLSLARFAGLAAATVAGACAVGAWPTWALAGRDGLVSMGMAAGAAFVGALVGWLPVSRANANPDPQSRVHAVQIALAVRLFVTLIAVVALLLGRAVPHRVAFVVWAGVAYAALLLLETRFALRAARDGVPPSGARLA